jgi:hypothetical protein
MVVRGRLRDTHHHPRRRRPLRVLGTLADARPTSLAIGLIGLDELSGQARLTFGSPEAEED